MAEYVLNTWYVAAWSHEVSTAPIRRVICELPVVLYRTHGGQAVALADRCAHRAYPLSAGVVLGDAIQCGYHGFEFGPDGEWKESGTVQAQFRGVVDKNFEQFREAGKQVILYPDRLKTGDPVVPFEKARKG